MKTLAPAAVVLSFVLGFSATLLYADSVDQLRDRAKSLQTKAADLADQGKKEEASKYVQEAHKLLDAADRAEKERGSQNSKDIPRSALQQLEQGGQRVMHLRVAAENLRAAGANDLAEQLTRQADDMERELRQARQSFAAKYSQSQDQDQTGSRTLRDEVEELRRQVEQLRMEVQEMRKQLSTR
jgi:protein subunit release factor A